MLEEIIRNRIKENGPLSFNEYMDMALYYPELGYYTSPGEKIGTGGDFYTAPQFSPLLACMLANQLEEIWMLLDKKDFIVVEYGAGTGSLCHDILEHLAAGSPELYSKIKYYIIEKSEIMRKKEKEILHEKVFWINSLKEIGDFTGCVLSNELIDNFPVHKVVMQDELKEVFINYKEGFTEELHPAGKDIISYTEDLDITLPVSHQTEINLEAVKWLKEIACYLRQGFIITIDYGYLLHELYSPLYASGTLTCYYKHHRGASFYKHIGMQDITSHVNFSALDFFGTQNGLQYCGFTTQKNFMFSLGLTNYLHKIEQHVKGLMSDKSHLKLLYAFFIEMGNRIKVLIQQKGFSQTQMLTGLRLSERRKLV